MSDQKGIGLSDIIKEDLDLLIVGDNPGLKSHKVGHHYANANNHFWPLLSETILKNRGGKSQFTHLDDASLPDYGIGLTCLCYRPSSSSAALSREELRTGAMQLLEKLHRFRPRVVCFNGIGIYQSFLLAQQQQQQQSQQQKQPKVRVGLQPQEITFPTTTTTTTDATSHQKQQQQQRHCTIKVFVMPSTSSRVTAFSKQDRLAIFMQLKQLLLLEGQSQSQSQI